VKDSVIFYFDSIYVED